MKLTSKNKLVVGLTGCILSGKSLALSYFKQCGAHTLSADELAHEALQSSAGQKAVTAVLGTCDKQALADKIFKNARARKQLEGILHPLVLKSAAQKIKKSANKITVFEVPLLFEAGWEDLFDVTMCICADERTLPARLKGRNLSRAEYERRLKTQWTPAQKASAAGLCVYHANTEDLGEKIAGVYRALLKFTV